MERTDPNDRKPTGLAREMFSLYEQNWTKKKLKSGASADCNRNTPNPIRVCRIGINYDSNDEIVTGS
jgi:hypothetical protein